MFDEEGVILQVGWVGFFFGWRPDMTNRFPENRGTPDRVDRNSFLGTTGLFVCVIGFFFLQINCGSIIRDVRKRRTFLYVWVFCCCSFFFWVQLGRLFLWKRVGSACQMDQFLTVHFFLKINNKKLHIDETNVSFSIFFLSVPVGRDFFFCNRFFFHSEWVGSLV